MDGLQRGESDRVKGKREDEAHRVEVLVSARNGAQRVQFGEPSDERNGSA